MEIMKKNNSNLSFISSFYDISIFPRMVIREILDKDPYFGFWRMVGLATFVLFLYPENYVLFVGRMPLGLVLVSGVLGNRILFGDLLGNELDSLLFRKINRWKRHLP